MVKSATCILFWGQAGIFALLTPRFAENIERDRNIFQQEQFVSYFCILNIML
jgi:hypothetical protein